MGVLSEKSRAFLADGPVAQCGAFRRDCHDSDLFWRVSGHGEQYTLVS